MNRKKQNGVSMVSLVITIIVIVILAAVAFSGSEETIGRAGFSGFVTDLDSVKTAFITEGIPALTGQESMKNNAVSKPQAYNYLAKGATELGGEAANLAWLSESQANSIQCTRIEPETAKAAIGIELPKRTVNTYAGTKIQMSYFVTNKGDIFVWPPYLRSDDGMYYVNNATTLDSSLTKEQIFTGAVTIRFQSGAVVTIDNSASKLALDSETVLTRIENGGLGSLSGIYYKDARNAIEPDGIESAKILQNTSPTLTTIAGWDTKDSSTGSDGTIKVTATGWGDLINAANDGSYVTKYQVGNRVELELQDGSKKYFIVVAHNHDRVAGTSERAHMTLISEETLANYKMRDNATNTGGWASSNVKTYLDTNPFIPNEVIGYIKPVIKTSNQYTGDGTTHSNQVQTTTDILWIPSYTEVGFTNSTVNGTEGGSKYPYFTDNGTRTKSGTSGYWWLRSANPSAATNFYHVNTDGSSYYNNANGSIGVALGFCL